MIARAADRPRGSPSVEFVGIVNDDPAQLRIARAAAVGAQLVECADTDTKVLGSGSRPQPAPAFP